MLLVRQATEDTKTERKEGVRIMIDMSKAKNSRECEEVNPSWVDAHTPIA